MLFLGLLLLKEIKRVGEFGVKLYSTKSRKLAVDYCIKIEAGYVLFNFKNLIIFVWSNIHEITKCKRLHLQFRFPTWHDLSHRSDLVTEAILLLHQALLEEGKVSPA